MPFVEVTASGINSRNARKPIVMNGRLRDVRQDAGPVQVLIQDQPGQEVQQHVEEGVHAEHPAQLDQPRRVEPVAQRRDRERDEQQPQTPLAERVLDLLDRIRAEVRAADLERTPHQRGERQQAEQKQRRLEDPADDGRGRHQKNFLRSMPL